MTEDLSSTSDPESAASADLEPVLVSVAEKIARHRGQNIGEQNTKLGLINPVLGALGWKVDDLEEVRHEFRRVPADKPVDYALMLARTPKLFVEAKALDENLDDRRWANQIISYATVAGVEWVVLTNGDEYRIYNSHAVAPVEEKLFRAVQISADPQVATEALLLLTKEHIRKNALSGLWQAYAIDRKVKEAVDGLFTPEPSPWLIRRLANQLEGLTQGDVKDALGRARIAFDFPAREQPTSSRPVGVPEPEHRRLPRPEEVSEVSGLDTHTHARPLERKGTMSIYARSRPASELDLEHYKIGEFRTIGVHGVQQLIDARLIAPPLELRRSYKGRELSGLIEPDGRVSFGGRTYNSLSEAAGMARKSVIGDVPGHKYPPTNGWTFWRFRDRDGTFRELSVLRERLAERNSRPTSPTA